MRRAIAIVMIAACAHAPAAVVPPQPTLSADVVAAELGDAGVTADVLSAWQPDGGTISAVRGAALLPQGWRAFGPSCVVPSTTCLAAGRKLAGDGAEITELDRVPPGVRPQIASALVGFGLGLAAGAAAGAFVYGLVKH